MRFLVKWSVTERVNGPGHHDGGVRDGDVYAVASGETEREAESPDEIRAELTGLLEQTWPREALGPTYSLDRTYEIKITPVDEG